MNRALFAAFTLSAAACSGAAATPDGGTTTATTAGTTTGSTTSGLVCSLTPCRSPSDCRSCAGYTCMPTYNNNCCADIGTACSADLDCCSDHCDLGSGVCFPFAGGCTENYLACTSSAACCSVYCAPDAGVCEPNPDAGSPTTSSTSGGSTTASSTTAAATTSSTSSSTNTGTSSSGTSASGGTTVGGSTGTSASTATGTSASSTSSSGGSATGTSGSTTGTSGTTTSAPVGLAFAWSFGAGQSCEQANAGWVTLQLDGGATQVAPCRDPSGTEGLTLPASAAAGSSVAYSATAYDALAGIPLSQVVASAQAPASGTGSVPVSFPLMASSNSLLTVAWTFGGASYADAGVTQLSFTLTDPKSASGDLMLTLDAGPGVTVGPYGAADYPISVGAMGSASYLASGSLGANGLSPSVLLMDLQTTSSGTTGDVAVTFTFAGGQSCAAAGFDAIGLQLVRFNASAAAPPVVLDCADAGASYTFTNVPAPATAYLWVEGLSNGQVQALAMPQVVIANGATASYTVDAQLAP